MIVFEEENHLDTSKTVFGTSFANHYKLNCTLQFGKLKNLLIFKYIFRTIPVLNETENMFSEVE